MQPGLLLTGSGLFALAILTRGGHAQAPAPTPKQPPAPAQPQTRIEVVATSGYVGSDTCVVCHTQRESLKGTAHAQAKNPRSPAATHGCESCHGPGQAHVDDDAKGNIIKFAQLPARREQRDRA